MAKQPESEVTHVKPRQEGAESKRDHTMTGGERAETPEERGERLREKNKPKEAPIIQSDVT